jgi:hypothetical protein
MKYIAKEECCMFGKVGPFDKAKMADNNKLYSQCNQCKQHLCKIEVREEK